MRGLAILAALLLLLSPSAAAAAAVVVDSNRPDFWKGEVRKSDPRLRDVPECRTNGCDRAFVSVRLPAGLRAKAGGVELAIQAVGATPDDSLGFAVYQGSRRVALADAQIGPARSVWLPKTTARYTVYVFYNPFVPELGSDVVRYEGLLENENSPRPSPRELLPDLEALPQRYATFETPPPFFDDVAAPGSSCFRSEVEEQNARKCLRFGQAMSNVGEGPVDVRYSTPAGQRPHEVPGSQRIYRADGTYRDVPSVGVMHYHEIHHHYHFEDFSVSRLENSAGAVVATGKKNGFCMADTEMPWWARKGNAPQSYPAPRCLDPEPSSPPGVDAFKNGISRGWADEYWWALPDQMIEVSALADGTYTLVTHVDPNNKIREAGEGNNCVRIPITLSGLATATPKAVLGTTPKTC
ncbi:lysyl oxidase [Lentzea atacamensis]|uniref:Lysyl oxidase n=1 Tax=Lentzea atacamensis TaxID=531938 RepID=A0A316IJ16_9PSEU|nr:lysyl oxidase family protein [Lentzea atacamensis]PWK87179.1 lysyl oxidase [Lentzea atacamensis]RAS70115.1 lysyl oxidase [Lentzea atacamensis]